MLNKTVSASIACLAMIFSPSVIAAGEIKQNSPSQYTVKKGDTLWDISSVFLNSPWRWTELWQRNGQISNPDLIYPEDIIYLSYRDGKPYFSTSKPGVVRLKPQIRVVDKYAALSVIPKKAISAFIQDNRIVDRSVVDDAPYILAKESNGAFIASGDSVYIKGELSQEITDFDIFRVGQAYGLGDGFDTQNIEINKVGELSVKQVQSDSEIQLGYVTRSSGVVKPADFMLAKVNDRLSSIYNISAAPLGLKGKIIRSLDNAHKIGRYDGVAINLGTSDNLAVGHVFSILKEPITVVDPKTNQPITISNRTAGVLLTVNVFENISYAIILNSTDAISAGDLIVSAK